MKSFLSILFSITLFFTSFSQENNCIDDPDGILFSIDGYQCNDIVGPWFSWGCDDDLSVAVPGAPSGMWTIGDLCPQSCDECDEENIINCIDDPDGILFSIDGYQCNDIVGPWFSWGCDDDLSVAVPGAPLGMWTIGDLCPQSCDECDEENIITWNWEDIEWLISDWEDFDWEDNWSDLNLDNIDWSDVPWDSIINFDINPNDLINYILDVIMSSGQPFNWDDFIDYFTLQLDLENNILNEKYIIQSINILGQNVDRDFQGVIFHLYNDGSLEKKYISK